MPTIINQNRSKCSWPTCLAPPDRTKLESSGIKASTAKANQLRTEGAEMVIPYRNLAGEVNGYAVRRPHAPGKGPKYVSPKGQPVRVFWPAATLKRLENENVPLYITEGPLKAMAIDQTGRAAAGVSGVNCCHEKGTNELLPQLAEVADGRVCFIVFDTDVKPKTVANVNRAKQKLANSLLAAGAVRVHDVILPLGTGETKMGVDDYLVTHGAKAFGELTGQADLLASTDERALADVREQTNRVIKIIPPVLGEAAYHGAIGQFLNAVAPHTEATDAGVLAHLLPAIGTLAGPAPYVFAGSKQPPRLNAVLVGPTSNGRKGTSFAPVNMLMQEVDSRFWQTQHKSGISSGEGLIAMVMDRESKNEDGETVVEIAEKRVMIVEEEFSRVMANMRREGNIASQVIRQAFDSGKLSTITVNPREANGAHISVVGHITPEELWAKATDIDAANGFGNRFMWFYVESDRLLPFTKPFPPGTFQPLIGPLRTLHLLGTHSEPFAVEMEPEAAKQWEQVYENLCRDRPGLAGAITARGSTIVLRTALIYCLVERWRHNAKPPKISAAHLEAALAVWRYSEESAYQLFGTKRDRLADKLLDLLADGPMSKTELNKHLSGKQKQAFSDTVARLVEAGEIRTTKQKQKGAGRPTTRWELAPAAHRT